MKYNDKLRLFFKSKDLSQTKSAEIMGVSPAMMGRYLKGSDNFSPEFICTLVKEFPDIDLRYIFSEEEENLQMVSEPCEDYNIKEEDIVNELKVIEQKISSIRNVLAQNRHNK